jgi:CcmD family protein
MKKSFLVILFLLVSTLIFAQNDVEMADSFRSDGKIYVVVAVIGIIFIGIIFYLFRTDQRLAKLEKGLPKQM